MNPPSATPPAQPRSCDGQAPAIIPPSSPRQLRDAAAVTHHLPQANNVPSIRPAPPDDKDRLIVAQARRIEALEVEADGLRKERDAMATKVALLSYKLQMYSRAAKQSRTQQQLELRQDLITKGINGGKPDLLLQNRYVAYH